MRARVSSRARVDVKHLSRSNPRDSRPPGLLSKQTSRSLESRVRTDRRNEREGTTGKSVRSLRICRTIAGRSRVVYRKFGRPTGSLYFSRGRRYRREIAAGATTQRSVYFRTLCGIRVRKQYLFPIREFLLDTLHRTSLVRSCSRGFPSIVTTRRDGKFHISDCKCEGEFLLKKIRSQ